MNNPYIDEIIAAAIGCMVVMLNHFTGFLNQVLLFEYFNSSEVRTLVMGAFGALGGLIAKKSVELGWKAIKFTYQLIFKKKSVARK